MMRELDTVSPVVWPAWCYSGEGQLETEAADATVPSAGGGGRKAGGRGGGGGGGSCTPTGAAMNGAGAATTATSASDSQPPAAAVKTERLSPPGPSTPGGGGGGGQQGAASSNSSTASSNSTNNQHHQSGAPDNNSTSSRSGTPGSSYPGTPPERAASPHPLKTEHLARNYSDFMRSLAAKYNNANPNDYLSSAAAAAAAAAAATGARNGYLDPRFAPFKSGAATPFVGLMAPLTAPASPLPGIKGGVGVGMGGGPAPGGSPKDEHGGGGGGGGGKKGGAGAGGPPTPAPTPAPATDLLGMFPPMIDMSSTQALLSMVRSANASQLENYLKGASSRRPAESSPLDLSPGAVVPPPAKRRAYHAPSRSIGESLFASKDTHRLRRLGSVSPKPRPPAPPPAASAAPAVGSRVLPCPSLCGAASAATCAPDAAATAAWSVDDVAAFVGSIDLCAEYAQNFREQRIDGCALPLLTEEHLTGALGMRLGPALKLRAALARRLGQCAACAHCLHCHAPQPAQPPPPASAAPTGHSPASRPSSTGV